MLKNVHQVKKQPSSTPVLAHYSPDKPTKVSVDASSYGLGGVPLQKQENDWKPVLYASRSHSNGTKVCASGKRSLGDDLEL